MTDVAQPLQGGWMERKFRFTEKGTTLARDTMAGLTTFIVMSYIIFVNPQILSFAGIEGLEGQGLPFDAVLAVTCLVAGVMTIAMGLYTNYAYAIAPGLGINATVAFGLVAGEGLSFPAAMGLIVVEGIAVTVFVLTGLRAKVMDAIPLDLKKAIAIGIGLFIAFIGFESAGIVVPGTPVVDLAPLTTWPIFVAMFGLFLTIALRARGVRGDLLIGIIASTVARDHHQRGLRRGRRLHGGRDGPRRRLRVAEPRAARQLQLRRLHGARVHLGRRLGVLALHGRLLRHHGDARRGRQAGRLRRRRGEAARDPQAAARRLALRRGRRRSLGLVGDDLHRVGIGRERRRSDGLGRRRLRCPLPARSCSSRRSSAWCRRRRLLLR